MTTYYVYLAMVTIGVVVGLGKTFECLFYMSEL